MALIATVLANKLKAFILNLNATKQENKETAIDAFCKEVETDVYAAIKSLTIVIETGQINVTGANSGGPVQCTNIAPIILNNVVK